MVLFSILQGCNSVHGCCDDRVTPAKGPRMAGCPNYGSVCEMPVHKGPCRASITRWYYHAGTCKSFIYGGCHGNQNNFHSEVECYVTCDAESSVKTKLTKSDGRITKTDAEGDTGGENVDSSEVLYAGCNESRFGCCSDGVSIPAGPNQENCPLYKTGCDMPKVEGTCGNRLVRYYYDMKRKRCDSFIFSGCGGNMNNFDSLEECQVKCGRSESSCRDSYNLCGPWREKGFCESSPDISGVYCKLTCDKCDDKL